MNAVITDLEPVLRGSIEEQIELSIALTAEVGHVVADRQQLERVIINLVGHARDAMPQGGRLHITTALRVLDDVFAGEHNVRSGIYVQLAVQDTGVGIAPETQAHIFEPFFTTKESGGNGLGWRACMGSFSKRAVLWKSRARREPGPCLRCICLAANKVPLDRR